MKRPSIYVKMKVLGAIEVVEGKTRHERIHNVAKMTFLDEEDFPKNHNLILIGQVELLSNLDLAVNQDLKSRVTYSVITRRLADDGMRDFIHRQLDRIGLAHNTFAEAAIELIIRSADGVLRRCRNLCLSAMLEAVRASAGRTIDIDLVNRVLPRAARKEKQPIRRSGRPGESERRSVKRELKTWQKRPPTHGFKTGHRRPPGPRPKTGQTSTGSNSPDIRKHGTFTKTTNPPA